MKKTSLLLLTMAIALVFLMGCVAALQNYEKVSLGMSKAEVKGIAGEPHRIVEAECSGDGPIVSKPGKYEFWFYRHGFLVFSGDKLVSKGRKVDTGGW